MLYVFLVDFCNALIALGISPEVVVFYAMIGGKVFHIIFASVIIICHITMVPGQLNSLPEGSFCVISLCTRDFYQPCHKQRPELLLAPLNFKSVPRVLEK
ncbi:hypothetical protein VNO77_14923 [Canavalia gladiata]|uniref:Uncharacterized protein n=1 Tax=Canavalia gladiata TaxID=3824 RepID=A0AAN9M3V4_CANGL